MTTAARHPRLRTTEETMSWVLDPLTEIPHVRHAVVLTTDGLIEGRSADLPRADAEGASAMLASIMSASRGLLGAYEGSAGASPVRQVVIEGHDGYAFLTSAGENTVISVYADIDVDLGVVAHEVQVQVKKLRRAMDSPPRETGAAGTGVPGRAAGTGVTGTGAADTVS
ncbi:roadblock/LC7 domain-containing protein [Streptomyces sp. AcH 505]|uniref:roadblock/LC7 domain-containing protein n=1 Tax=Streptomyces sp. AcH 505 TaxID=352211 RepID=UPI000694A401